MIALLVLSSVIATEKLRTQVVAIETGTAGTVFVVGTNWKAELAAGGVQFTPFLGADAPENEYVRFEPSHVTIDGVTIASNDEAGVQCAGHTLRYERGAFDEVFDARLEGLEHQLSFNALPTRGELVVRCPVDSSLTAQQVGDAIEFVNERGGVRYPDAIAFDAAGRRMRLATFLVDSTLVLTVPSDFVANAVLPLTIDPLIHVFGVATGPTYQYAADVSAQWVNLNGIHRCEVFETVWSAVDHDITARVTRMETGTVSEFLIDATTEYWSEAKVASLLDSKIQSRFLVVAAAGQPSSGARTIRGRDIRLMFNGFTLGAVIAIDVGVTGDNHHPDVGGDPFSQGSGTFSYFNVVWQSDKVNGDSDIHGARFPWFGYPIAVDPSTDDENPRLSKMNGSALWCTAWERTAAPNNRDIWASTYAYGTTVASSPFVISNAPEDESSPSVSSLTVNGFVIAYEREMGGQRDVIVQRLTSGGTVDPGINFTQLEGGTHFGLDQQWPVVDGGNDGFVLAYRDDDPVAAGLKRTRFTSFQVSGAGQFVLHDIRQSLGNPGINRTAANVCSHFAVLFPTPPPHRFEIVWDEVPAPGDNDVFAALYFDGTIAGGVESACYGDGSITACPCVSNGGAPAGCPNSSQATGGELQWTGNAKVSVDTFVIQALRLTPNAPVALAGGSVFNANGIVYGDGLLCLSGSLTRLVYRVTSATGTLTYPEFVTDPRISIAGGVSGGVTQSYQLVYRDSPAFCTPGTFNTTNALVVSWAP